MTNACCARTELIAELGEPSSAAECSAAVIVVAAGVLDIESTDGCGHHGERAHHVFVFMLQQVLSSGGRSQPQHGKKTLARIDVVSRTRR